MKLLKWFLAFALVSGIGNMTRMYLSHRQSVIDDGMQKIIAEIKPKLPTQNDLGLTVTNIEYAWPTLKQYFSISNAIDPDQYKQKLTDQECQEKMDWMFKKGLRIENIFKKEAAADSNSLDMSMSMPDTVIVMDDQQCQHRGEADTYVAPAPAPSTTPIQANVAAAPLSNDSQAYTPAAPAVTPDSTTAAPAVQ
jgi:hypothetical protein